MSQQAIPVAIIGLDTSHAVEFVRRMQAPDCPAENRVPGLRAVSCFRFPSPFQDAAGQDARQAQLAAWDVPLCASVEEACAGAEAILLEVNDPAQHQRWFEAVAPLGKPVFIDKPLADGMATARAIAATAAAHGTAVASCSPMRCDAGLEAACRQVPQPQQVAVYGPLGKAPAGSSVTWYGVHACEMVQRAMGAGAVSVQAHGDAAGVVVIIDYGAGRRAVVELTAGSYLAGGVLRAGDQARVWQVDNARLYTATLRAIEAWLRGGSPPADVPAALAVQALLDAIDRSLADGSPVPVAF